MKCRSIIMFLAALFVCASSLSQTDSSTIRSVTVALQNKRYQYALHLSGRELDRYPGNYQLWTLRALAYSGLDQPSKALVSYNRALALSAHYMPAVEGAAQIYYQKGETRAIPLLKDLLRQDPENAVAHGMLADMDYRQHNCEDAVPHFEKSISLLASSPVVYQEFADCLYQLGRYDEAASELGKILEMEPASQTSRYNLASAQWKAKQNQNAMKTLEPLIGSNSSDEKALSLASAIAEGEDNTPEAIRLLRQAIVANPKNEDLYLQFAMLSFTHNSMNVGIELLNIGLAQIPDAASLYFARGVLLIQTSNYEKGLADLETANKLDPTLSLASSAEGLLNSQRHNLSQAITKFRKAIQVDPKDAYSHYLLAEALLSKNRDVGSKYYIEGMNAAKKAVELDPGLVEARDLLATIDLEHGDIQNAILQSRAALLLNADDEAAVYHLILALRKTDNKSDIPELVKRLGVLKKNSNRMASQARILQLEK